MPRMSSDFEWDLVRKERTVEGFDGIFDIQKAKQIIVDHPREVVEIDLLQHREVFESYIDEDVRLKDDTEWENVDSGFPVIFGRFPGKLPIDGRHRIAKALRDSETILYGIFLTKDETESIRFG